MNYVYIHEIHSDVKKTQVLYRRADALFWKLGKGIERLSCLSHTNHKLQGN